VITHAHSDHAAAGCAAYVSSAAGAAVLRRRVGPEARIDTLAYGEPRSFQGVRISLHPAGHILGSAQVRVEHAGEVWVVSGDYKIQPDRTCEPFEPLRCDVFITESTFGLPIYRWRPQEEVFNQINGWWRENRAQGRTSIVFAYALGKAQRVIAGLDPSIGPIAAHGAVANFVDVYREAGVPLPEVWRIDADRLKEIRGAGLVLAPPSAGGSPWIRKFGEISAGMASGWMQVRGARRWRNVDRGFVLSDHADWPSLLETIRATGASRVLVTHGFTAPLVRYLRESGLDAQELQTRYSHGEDIGQDEETAPGSEGPPSDEPRP
jgi:putative mRNA 3-end processing factor